MNRYLHKADRSNVTDDMHSLEVAAEGQAGYLRVSNIAFMSICRQIIMPQMIT